MTLKEVARLAGVSPAAVSRYLNGGSLSEEKSQRIRQTIEATGYRPNQAAQTLRTGHFKQIGVIVPRIESFTVSRVISGINEGLAARDYMPVLGCTNLRDDLELQYLDMMQANHVAGIILMGTSVTPEKVDAFRACAVPLVITGQNVPGLPCIHHDDYNAMKELTSLVLARGRRKLAYLGVSEEDPAAGIARRQGAQDALREAGLDPAALLCLQSGFSIESGYCAAQQLLEQRPDVDGVLCATDKIAHGAMQALKAAGKRLPQEVSIAGVGENWANRISTPQLTTVHLYHQECGRVAAAILLEMIEQRQKSKQARQIKLGYTLVERASI